MLLTTPTMVGGKEIVHTTATIDIYNKLLTNKENDSVTVTLITDGLTAFNTMDTSILSNLKIVFCPAASSASPSSVSQIVPLSLTPSFTNTIFH